MKFLALLAAAAVVVAPVAAVAQDKWPTQNITFLVPFRPGDRLTSWHVCSRLH